MTARCQLCGVTVTGRFLAPVNATPAQVLMEYDHLASVMWQHIIAKHMDQMLECGRHQQRAAKLYAMNWADHDAAMLPIKHQWRQEMLLGMTVTTRRANDPQAAAADAADAAGSNEKNSERKRSN